MSLTHWQQTFFDTYTQTVDALVRGESPEHVGIVIPGPPGTGKTFVTKKAYEWTKETYPAIANNVYMVATTGAAASRFDGMTLASFLSIGSDAMKLDKEPIVDLMRSRKPERVRTAKIVFLDEVSMLSQRQFENLNRIFQDVRETPTEFGGVFMVITGDPFQLPPVPHDSGFGTRRLIRDFVPSMLERQYPGWSYIVADQLMRAEDENLRRILLQLFSESDDVVRDAFATLNTHCFQEELSVREGILYQQKTGALILCYPKEGNCSVDSYNRASSDDLSDSEEFPVRSPEQLHDLSDSDLLERANLSDIHAEERTIRDRDSWPKSNTVIKGVPYMIRYNGKTQEGDTVFNGMMGEVLHYDRKTDTAKMMLYASKTIAHIPRHEFRSEWIPQIGYKALPLIPAAAMTIHKVQGATVTKILLETRSLYNNDKNAYIRHLLYTALSRVRKLEDIRLTDRLDVSLVLKDAVKSKISMIWKLPYMSKYPRV